MDDFLEEENVADQGITNYLGLDLIMIHYKRYILDN